MPMSTLTRLYDFIDDIGIAMMTTRRADGHLRSRPMATQKAAPGADLWFVARTGSGKLAELAVDPHVNVAYLKGSSGGWVSVSGEAVISQDRAIIHQLYSPDWAIWFDKGDDPRHGTAEDPRIALIGVTVHGAEFLEVNGPRPVVLFEIAKGWLTGNEPELGEMHRLTDPHRPAP
jgi:general stress protein 26